MKVCLLKKLSVFVYNFFSMSKVSKNGVERRFFNFFQMFIAPLRQNDVSNEEKSLFVFVLKSLKKLLIFIITFWESHA